MPQPFAELRELPRAPVSCLKKPVSKSEREMLHEELDILREEKQALQTEVDNLKQTVEMVKFSSLYWCDLECFSYCIYIFVNIS